MLTIGDLQKIKNAANTRKTFMFFLLRAALCFIFILLPCVSIAHAKKIKYIPVKDAQELKNYVGQKVVVKGTVSNTPWQHVMNPPETHPVEIYFDIGKWQIVLYAKEKISCAGKVKVKGKVMQLGGESKPGAKETVTEYHIVVDKWKCVK